MDDGRDAVQVILRFLAKRFTASGGRQSAGSAVGGPKFLAAGTLRAEIGQLRVNSYVTYGKVPWNPRTLDGNPFLADELDQFARGATKQLLEMGVVPVPAAEANAQELATIVFHLQNLVDSHATARSAPPWDNLIRAIRWQQLLVFFLCGFVWGDRIGDVVARDSSDVIIFPADGTEAQWQELVAEGHAPRVSLGEGQGWKAAMRPGQATSLVRYTADKGARISGDPLLRNRVRPHPVLHDNAVEPTGAISRLLELYALVSDRHGHVPGFVGGTIRQAASGPLIRAFPATGPSSNPIKSHGAWSRVVVNTFDTRVNSFLATVLDGRFRHLTSHSFRRGGAQELALRGATPLQITLFGRWRQEATMYRYLQPARPAGATARTSAVAGASAPLLVAAISTHAAATVAMPVSASAVALALGPASRADSLSRRLGFDAVAPPPPLAGPDA